VAGECAAQQDKFWEMHDVLYDSSGEFTPETLLAMADEAGLNNSAFANCLQDPNVAAEVAADLADGVAAGVVGTPTFFFNGQKIEGAIPFSTYNDLIHAFLAT
jgi:protein-disulfide isomerase